MGDRDTAGEIADLTTTLNQFIGGMNEGRDGEDIPSIAQSLASIAKSLERIANSTQALNNLNPD